MSEGRTLAGDGWRSILSPSRHSLATRRTGPRFAPRAPRCPSRSSRRWHRRNQRPRPPLRISLPLPRSQLLRLLPEGDEKRRFNLDCTGCHTFDARIAAPNGRARRRFNGTRRLTGCCATQGEDELPRDLRRARTSLDDAVARALDHSNATGTSCRRRWSFPTAAGPRRGRRLTASTNAVQHPGDSPSLRATAARAIDRRRTPPRTRDRGNAPRGE